MAATPRARRGFCPPHLFNWRHPLRIILLGFAILAAPFLLLLGVSLGRAQPPGEYRFSLISSCGHHGNTDQVFIVSVQVSWGTRERVDAD
jgi:hypothetical protein